MEVSHAVTDVVSKVGAAGAGVASWAVGLPTVVVVLVVLGPMVLPPLRDWLLAREQTRREVAAWEGAVNVYRADGDGAAVARGLRGGPGGNLPLTQAESRRPAGAG